MGRRIVARIVSVQVNEGVEDMDLLSEIQLGFRSGRSTADASEIMIRLQEDVMDLQKRKADERFVPLTRLLDLRKAYPRVNKAALWLLLKKYRLLQDHHERTEYKLRGKEGNSEPWVPELGLTEGYPLSPGLFNIYQDAAMRLARKEREKKVVEDGRTAGKVMKWVPECGSWV